MQFLHPVDPVTKKRHMLRCQLLEFMLTFIVQLCNSYLKPDSMHGARICQHSSLQNWIYTYILLLFFGCLHMHIFIYNIHVQTQSNPTVKTGTAKEIESIYGYKYGREKIKLLKLI